MHADINRKRNTMTDHHYTRANARLTGFFFILAAVSSITGLKLYDPVLNDSYSLLSASNNYFKVVWGAINELILMVSATGTGLMLFPVLKRYSESAALGYLCFRLLEVVFILIGTVSILTALSISRHYTGNLITDAGNAQDLMLAFTSVHKWAFMLGPNFMLAINTFLYSYAFIKLGAVPKNLARLGISASVLIMAAAILEMFGIIQQISAWGILLALPIAAYEMTLAGWLIAKGIKS